MSSAQRSAFPEDDPVLIAVSLKNIQPAPYIGPHGVCKRATIRGESTTPGASFTFETGLLSAEQVEHCAQLERHGFTVVEAPNNWRYAYDNLPGGWQAVVIRNALDKVADIFESKGGQTLMSKAYDPEFTHSVLEKINKSFPNGVTAAQLKRRLDPEPSDDALLTALDALLTDGLIKGSAYRGELSKLIALANIGMTKDGRKHLEGQAQQPITPPIVHGDQIINYGQAGAIGRHSHGVVNVHEHWKEIEHDTDLRTLAGELERLRTEYRKVASSRDDDRQIVLLGDAADEAEKGNGDGAATYLSKVGTGVLTMAKEIGLDLTARVLVKLAQGGQ